MRLAIVSSHPIQYNSPWFRYLATHGFEGMRVFYLWDGGTTETLDRGFGVKVKWDIPLLDGYDHEFVPNVARQPGTHHWRGLDNPGLADRLAAFGPEAILVFGYNYLTHYRLLFSRHSAHRPLASSHSRLSCSQSSRSPAVALRPPTRVPLLFRGDSHRLVPERGLHAGLRRQWLRLIYRRFAAFLFVGQANKAYFQLHGVFFAAAGSAQEDAAKWKAALGVAPGKRVVLFAGKFEGKKRPRDVVAAFKQAELKDTTLLLVGNGEQEAVLREDAAGRPNIVFAPFQNQSQMPRTYAAGDVFVLPSFGRGETWGLAVNEALCLGRPVIVSSHVGCAQDLVEPGRNGLVFPAGDVSALTAALREAFTDPERLCAWGARSREIIQRYDYEHATEGLRKALAFVKS